ncbi:bacillithiol biosynthesis cysteine-adding enzyme BshC [Fodinibius halophilus]|uniref:Putative cysteine ligase BshC n=1 Tax=Fodinibius halophilus TaxID=1736908 RepID=A0A6M1T9A0_9BACT|nr:bacillithiol biosynthesis cysteine-adding enzyme BshC [Fodinibius halophilus]NGP86952.1 bacillithiol biosynthesis cysteine-adding enzyme BshC [Fodinibius halophilus]
MQLTNYSFEALPFSDLFKTYITDYHELSDFYGTNPFDEEAIAQRADQFNYSGDRERTSKILSGFNKCFNIAEAAQENIKRLADEQSLAVVTGQQLGIYGGPLYTVLKTITTIHLAKQMEEALDRPVIPIFWLADEDHDYEEVRSLSVLEGNNVQSYGLPSQSEPLPAVADIEIPDDIEQLKADLKDSLYDTDFSDELWELLDSSFKAGNTFFEAFGQWISSLFSKHGLVLAGSKDIKVKEATGSFLKKSILKADDIRNKLESRSGQISEQFHSQVTLYDSNLFYLNGQSGRTKIARNGEGWKTDSGQEWETDQLIEEIEENPENFSPNVFLRPILQDALLPTLGYVAGPGETAYYGQMKEMYGCFDMEMPVIFPRLSATIVEPAIDRIINELPFDFHEYGNRIEDLESDYVDRTEQHDIEAIFNDWHNDVEALAEDRTKKIADIDPTLEGASEKATATYLNELNKLKGKVYRSVKKQDKIQLKRIRRIKANTFPGDGLQERVIAGIYFMNKYGIDIWDKLLENLDEKEQFDHHKLIYL